MVEIASLGAFAVELGLSVETILDQSETEFREWTKDMNVLQRAKVCRERKILKKEAFATSIDNLQLLCQEAQGTIEEILALSRSDLGVLSMDILSNKLCQHGRLIREWNQRKGAASGVAASLPEVYVSSVESDITMKTEDLPAAPDKIKSEESSQPAAVPKKSVKKPSATSNRKGTSSKKGMSSVPERICNALHTLASINIKEAPRRYVAILSGYGTPSTAGFKKAITETKKAGLIAYLSDGNLGLTENAISSLPSIVPLKSNAEMQARLRTLLSPKQEGMFQFLSDGKEHDLDTLATSSGYNSASQAGFKKTYGKLSVLGLTEKVTSKSVQLADIAFPFGRNISRGQPGAGADAISSSSVSACSLFIEPLAKVKTEDPPVSPDKIKSEARTQQLVAVSNHTTKKLTATSGCKSKSSKPGTPPSESVSDRICRVLLELRALGIHEPPRTQVAMYAGYPEITKSNAFTNIVCKLKTAGLVEYPDGKTLRLTSGAIQSLAPVAPLQNNAEAQERLKGMVRNAGKCPAKKKTLQIFEHLCDGKVYSKLAVAKMAGYDDVTSDSLANILCWMKTHGLIIKSNDSLQLSDLAFPFGRIAATTEGQTLKLPPVPSFNAEIACTTSNAISTKKRRSTAVAPVSQTKKAAKRQKTENAGKDNPRNRVLHALLELQAINIFEAPTMMVMLLSDYKNVSSTGFVEGLKQLKNELFVESAGKGKLRLTDSAIDAVTPIEPPKNTTDLQNRLAGMITKVANGAPLSKTKLFLEALKDGKAHKVDEMLEATGYKAASSTGFASIRSVMTKLGLIETNKGSVKLTDIALSFQGNPVGAAQIKAPVAGESCGEESARRIVSSVAVERKCRPTGVARVAAKTTNNKRQKTKTAVKGSPRDRVLRALLELRALNICEAPTMLVVRMSGYQNIASKGLAGSLTQLRRERFVESSGGKLRLTGLAIDRLTPIEPPKDIPDLQNRLVGMIREVADVAPPAAKTQVFLEKLSDGKAHEIAEMLEATGYKGVSSKGFQCIRSAMTKLGILETNDGTLKLTDIGLSLQGYSERADSLGEFPVPVTSTEFKGARESKNENPTIAHAVRASKSTVAQLSSHSQEKESIASLSKSATGKEKNRQRPPAVSPERHENTAVKKPPSEKTKEMSITASVSSPNEYKTEYVTDAHSRAERSSKRSVEIAPTMSGAALPPNEYKKNYATGADSRTERNAKRVSVTPPMPSEKKQKTANNRESPAPESQVESAAPLKQEASHSSLWQQWFSWGSGLN